MALKPSDCDVVEARRDAGPRAAAVCVDVGARGGGVVGWRESEAVGDDLVDGAGLPLLGCASGGEVVGVGSRQEECEDTNRGQRGVRWMDIGSMAVAEIDESECG